MPTETRRILQQLIANREIPIGWAPIFDTVPGPIRSRDGWDRVEGMLLGLAIGDALGNTTEGLLPSERNRRYGQIDEYLRRDSAQQPVGLPSDDTQLTFWTLEQLLIDGGFVPAHLADRFSRQHIFGIGASITEFLRAYKAGNKPWYRCGAQSAGNGALMRIAVMLVPHLRTGTPDLWADIAISAAVTHRDPASIAACVAFVNILWGALQLDHAPASQWWVQTYADVARSLEKQTTYRPRGGAFTGYTGPLWRYVEERIDEALRRDQHVLEACNSWYSGAYLLETMPSVIYILMRHAHDPVEAILRAVNDTKDNDTIAAIVGAAVGALHGRQALPRHWLARLSGRTGEHDDGRIFQLIEDARETFWERG
ncbi:MAG TPA: ADP-ribosylglycohydrolase family protein [Herpetosiphonaceae bacterium]|nr:ADP-ribosylglycohydrolase family protein [Herpetosiphonaceae bacterium]